MHTGLTAFTNQRLFTIIISGSCSFAFCIYIIFLCRAVHYKYSSHTLNICIKKRIREIPSSSKCYLYSNKVFPNLYCLKYFNNSFVQNSCEKRNMPQEHVFPVTGFKVTVYQMMALKNMNVKALASSFSLGYP